MNRIKGINIPELRDRLNKHCFGNYDSLFTHEAWLEIMGKLNEFGNLDTNQWYFNNDSFRNIVWFLLANRYKEKYFIVKYYEIKSNDKVLGFGTLDECIDYAGFLNDSKYYGIECPLRGEMSHFYRAAKEKYADFSYEHIEKYSRELSYFY